MKFIPQIDHPLVVDLPGERLPATVRRLVNHNNCIVELTQMPLAKAHNYKVKDLVPVRRTLGALGETWQAISKSEMRLAAEKAKKKTGRQHAASAR